MTKRKSIISALAAVLILGTSLDSNAATPGKKKRTFRRTAATERKATPPEPKASDVSILGESVVSPESMWEFVKTKNVDFPYEIAEAFFTIGEIYGIRGDIALCQAILETGWFEFSGGTAVTPDQHNYCGLGVTSLGKKGHSFNSIYEGVTAHIQHLYAYACKNSIPEGEELVDPRFKYVKRGVAPSWESLNLRWAANDKYGQSILALYSRMLTSSGLSPLQPTDPTEI